MVGGEAGGLLSSKGVPVDSLYVMLSGHFAIYIDRAAGGRHGDLLEALPGWAVSDDGKTISKDFGFKNFFRTMAFVNAIAWIANREDETAAGVLRVITATMARGVRKVSVERRWTVGFPPPALSAFLNASMKV